MSDEFYQPGIGATKPPVTETVLTRKRPKRTLVVQTSKVDPSSPTPKPGELLEDVYRLVKTEVEKYKGFHGLNELQAKSLIGLGEFLIKATREARILEREEKELTDKFIQDIIKDPAARSHLRKLLEEFQDG